MVISKFIYLSEIVKPVWRLTSKYVICKLVTGTADAEDQKVQNKKARTILFFDVFIFFPFF